MAEYELLVAALFYGTGVMQVGAERVPPSAISPVEVRSELDKIIASTRLHRTPQLQRMLTFLVLETLDGRGDRLKEYVIGVEVFGRPAAYDPRIDSLVRVEARRLRHAIEEYYAEEGKHDLVLIELNKGTYQPCFHRRAPAAESYSSNTKSITSGSPRVLSWALIFALMIAAAGASAYFLKAPHSASSPRTIAVLPFENLSSDPENEYLCFGLLDEITTELAKTPGLRVVARTSASSFNRGDDIDTIARRLKADAILEGSVRKSGNTVLVTAQLISANDSLHIWSERYERSSTDLLRVQDEIAQTVTRELRLRLIPQGTNTPQRVRYSSNAEANQLYWKGSYVRAPMGHTNWRRDLVKSADYFEQALQKDGNFALAHAALADIYVSLAWERGGGPVTDDFMSRGRRAALRAIELDDTQAEAYGALGTIQFFYDYDRVAAEKSFRRALELDQNNGKVRMWYAYSLTMQRRADEALAQARHAKDLDPLSYVATTHLGVVNYFSRRNDEAIRLVRETLEVANIAPAHGLLGMAYEVQRNYPAAIDEYQAGLRMVPNHPYIKGMLGHAYAMSGRTEEAMQLLRDANLEFEKGGLSDLKQSYIYLALGDRDRAFEHLEKDYEMRDPELPYINADPVFDPVRSDPRFRALLQKLRLAD